MIKQQIPVLPLRDIVVFPHMVAPLFVGRQPSVKALNSVMTKDKKILLITQKNSEVDSPKPENLYKCGTLAKVLQLLKLPDGTIKVLVEGFERVRILSIEDSGDFLRASYSILSVKEKNTANIMALAKIIKDQFESYQKINKKISIDVVNNIKTYNDFNKLADVVIANLNINLPQKQKLLETKSLESRLDKIYGYLVSEIDALQVEKKIKGRVKRQMEKTQKEYYLNEQMKAIQKELGDIEDIDDITEVESKLKEVKLSPEALDKCKSELKKLKNMSPMSAEATVVRNYLDWMIDIPWFKKDKIDIDLNKALKTLDEDHFGLEKIKERIIEFLAVQKRMEKIKGPILCFVGPPGVGKTSLGKSIARATNRQFVRMSLGGIRDEAEIRGHRRTYIGSLPGKIIQMMKKAGTKNPLILLDEVDKIGNDYRGDPSSALLEALDPEQNASFNDHYLEVDYDLSDVMFVTTANTLNILPPLLDRMEVIRIPGYTEDEKINIANKFLLPKQIKAMVLRRVNLKWLMEQLKKLLEIILVSLE